MEISLGQRKIETKVHYRIPLHETNLFNLCSTGPGMLASASSLARRTISLPFYPELTDLEVEYIADQVITAVQAHA